MLLTLDKFTASIENVFTEFGLFEYVAFRLGDMGIFVVTQEQPHEIDYVAELTAAVHADAHRRFPEVVQGVVMFTETILQLIQTTMEITDLEEDAEEDDNGFDDY